MVDIVFSPEAKHDLSETGDYIAFKLRNKSAARNLISRILYGRRHYLSILFGEELCDDNNE